MPLPQEDSIWPPQQVQVAYDAYRVWDAWLTGDPSKLEIAYATPSASNRGGLWGGIKRVFWGTPLPGQAAQAPVKLHVPVAGEISRMSANLLYGEMFDAKFEPEADDSTDTDGNVAAGSALDKSNKRLDELLDDAAHARFLESAEYQSGHGGVFIKIAWDQVSHPTGPFLVVMPADTAVPEFRFGQLSAVTFWTRLAPIGKQTYLLLERHEPGVIEFGLFESSAKGMLGTRVDLAVHPDTASLATMVNDQSQVETGSPLLTARYFANLKPNRKWRSDPLASNLGRSDYDGAEDLMDALDETHTAWMRDVRLGKARIMVPKGMLTPLGPGQGAQFNNDQEIYTELGEQVGSLNPNATNGNAGSFIQTYQPEIRYQAFEQTVVSYTERIYAACGYSAQSFGEAGDTAVTATEVTSREKLTILTRQAKILIVRPEIAALLAALLDVDQFVFDGPGRVADTLPTIEFPDAASENPQVVAQTLSLLNTSQSASIQTRVEMLHPDWDTDQVAAEVQRIRDDDSMLPDPSTAHLWAAVSDESSATGGVQANQSGAQTNPAQIAAIDKADKAVVASEDKTDGAAT